MSRIYYLKKCLVGALVTLSLGVFVVLYSYLSWESVRMPLLRFSAPDEQANYFFSKLFAQQSVLMYPEPLLEVSQDFVHTRSMTASKGEVKPVGFLGFALIYGFLGKLFGVGAIPFFTPVLGVITAFFFYAAIKRIFNNTIAVVSSALLLLHPAYWYYSSRALMPNVLFVDLFIIGVSMLVIASSPERKSWYVSSRLSRRQIAGAVGSVEKHIFKTALMWVQKIVHIVKQCLSLKILFFLWGGFFIALSLTVRLSESLWVGALLLCWGLLYIRRLSVWRILAFCIGFAVPIAVLLSYNYSLYGNILSSGYKMNTAFSTDALSATAGLIQQGHWGGLIDSIKNIIRPYMPLLLPFGYRPDIFWNNGWNYIVTFFWWFTIPTVAGLFLILRNEVVHIMRHRVPHRLWYVLAWVWVTAWLVIFYGSWKLTDNINGGVTLGVSYVRYWLPSYIMALPFLAALLVWLYKNGRSSTLRRVAGVVLVGVIALLSARLVLVGGQESLVDNKEQLSLAQTKAQTVFEHTEQDAVIFSERSDKLFFPERKVAGSFAEFPERHLITTLIVKAPVYYYGLWDPKAAAYVSKKYFEPIGIRWEYIATVSPREHLYRLTVITP